MYKKIILVFALLSLIILSSCSGKEIKKVEEAKILQLTLEGKWLLEEINGVKLNEQINESFKESFINFNTEEKRVNGVGTCNNFMGSYKINGDMLEFSPIASTLMYCPNLEVEGKIFRALEKVRTFQIKGNELFLLGEDEVLLKYKKEVIDTHNSKTSLDWNGIYKGVIPSASGMGIELEVSLNKDLSYTIKSTYLGENSESFEENGVFSWNEDGSKIFFGEDKELGFKVIENGLIKLDIEGNEIISDLNYRLNKI